MDGKLDLLLVDGRHLLWRSTSVLAMPSKRPLPDGAKPREPLKVTLPDGTQMVTGGIYGFISILLSVWSQFGGKVFVAWDCADGPTERLKIHPDYKHRRTNAGRPADDPSVTQRREILDMIRMGEAELNRLLSLMGVRQAKAPGWEADDVVATLVTKFKGKFKLGILSGDRDMMRLVRDDVILIRPMKAGAVQVATPEVVQQEYGVEPNKVLDLKALAGDDGDNIPGADGIGPKTAAKLLSEHGTWQGVLDWAIANEPKYAWHKSLIAHQDDVRMSAVLADLNFKAHLEFTPAAPSKRELFFRMAQLKFASLMSGERAQQLNSMAGL